VSVRQNASQSLANGSFTKINYDTIINDPQLRWSTSGSDIGLVAPGNYLFIATVSYASAAANTSNIISIFATPPGGSAQEFQRGPVIQTTFVGNPVLHGVFGFNLPSNAYFATGNTVPVNSLFDIRVFQNSGGALNTNPSSAGNGPVTDLTIMYLGNH